MFNYVVVCTYITNKMEHFNFKGRHAMCVAELIKDCMAYSFIVRILAYNNLICMYYF